MNPLRASLSLPILKLEIKICRWLRGDPADVVKFLRMTLKFISDSRLVEREFDYQLENDPRFLARIESARQSLRQGRGVRIEDLDAKPVRPSHWTGKKRPN